MSTDENTTLAAESDDAAADASVAEASAEVEKLSLALNIEDVGPCKKHISVTVPRSDVDRYVGDAVAELATTANVPGFRVGRVPKALIEKRFRKELDGEVKQKLLIDSLDQISEEHDLDPINEPNIDLESIELPEEGDFEYEFEVEVRPSFELPDYAGMTIKRPVREVSEEDIDAYLNRFLSQYGRLTPVEGAAEAGDYLTASVDFVHNEESIREIDELTVQLKPILRFQDAEFEGFDELMAGVSAGETREAELIVSMEAEQLEMRGESVFAKFHVNEVKRLHMPELTAEFLRERVGVDSQEALRTEVREILERQVTYQQRQAVRDQVLEKITESADWDLPEDLVRKQVENALHREILEMQQAGFTTPEIRARENELRQQAVTSTRKAMKEHFVLDKLAEKEEIDVSAMEIEAEIRLMAMQRGESPRRLRARLQKSGVIENLEAQIRERKAVDHILASAKFEDVDMARPVEDRIEAVHHSICGSIASSVATDEGDEEDEAE